MTSDSELRRRTRTLAADLRAAAGSVPETTWKAIAALMESYQATHQPTGPSKPASTVARGLNFEASNKQMSEKFAGRLSELAALLAERGVPTNSLVWPGTNLLIDGDDLRTLAGALERAVLDLGGHLGYVAFIDLLGFSRRVALGAPEEFFVAYEEAVARALDGHGPVRYVVSSDSIVLYVPRNNAEGLVQVCNAVGRLFYELLCIKVPIRGAISYGKFREARTNQGTIIAGPPILDAVEYEKRQEWVGVMLTPSLVEQHPHLSITHNLRPLPTNDSAMTGPRIIASYSIPFKSGEGIEAYTGFAIVPNPCPTGDTEAGKVALARARASLASMHRFAPDPASQAKHRASLDFVNKRHETYT